LRIFGHSIFASAGLLIADSRLLKSYGKGAAYHRLKKRSPQTAQLGYETGWLGLIHHCYRGKTIILQLLLLKKTETDRGEEITASLLITVYPPSVSQSTGRTAQGAQSNIDRATA
jgi:hypothetical protein